jgi:hypothetical protein
VYSNKISEHTAIGCAIFYRGDRLQRVEPPEVVDLTQGWRAYADLTAVADRKTPAALQVSIREIYVCNTYDTYGYIRIRAYVDLATVADRKTPAALKVSTREIYVYVCIMYTDICVCYMRCSHQDPCHSPSICNRNIHIYTYNTHRYIRTLYPVLTADRKTPAALQLTKALERSTTMAQVLLLTPVANSATNSGANRQILCAVNTHLFGHPDATHVRVFQAATLMRHVERVFRRHAGVHACVCVCVCVCVCTYINTICMYTCMQYVHTYYIHACIQTCMHAYIRMVIRHIHTEK